MGEVGDIFRMIVSVVPPVLLAVALLALSSCSDLSTDADHRKTTDSQLNFSAEEKRIARRLSIRNDVIQDDTTAQFQAERCRLSLATIQVQMQNSGMLSAEQQRVFKQAQNLYRRRAEAELSSEEYEKTLADVKAKYPELSDRVPLAIACLRNLT